MKDVPLMVGSRAAVFEDAGRSFERLYISRGINPNDDEAVVEFLKRETGFPYSSATNLAEERRALELAYLADILEALPRFCPIRQQPRISSRQLSP